MPHAPPDAAAVRAFLAELYRASGEEPPDLDDAEIEQALGQLLEAAGTCKPGERADLTGCVPGTADPKAALDQAKKKESAAYDAHKANPTPATKKAYDSAQTDVLKAEHATMKSKPGAAPAAQPLAPDEAKAELGKAQKEFDTATAAANKSKKGEDWKKVAAAQDKVKAAQKAVDAGKPKPAAATVVDVPAKSGTGALSDTDVRKEVTPASLPKEFKNHADKTAQGLSEKHIVAIEDYSLDAYKSINGSLRQCPKTLDCLTPKDKATLDSLQDAIKQAGPLPAPVNAYRGVSGKVADQIWETAKQAHAGGKGMQLPGVTSLSLNPEVARGFTDKNGLIFEVKAKSGAYIASESAVPHEMELLHGHNTKYKVTGLKEGIAFGEFGKKHRVIQMEEI